MSAFLGKIHYWLYDKIKLHEKLIENIVELAERNGYNNEILLSESYSKYGAPVKGLLENEIEHSNIHGWLQERIISVESRLAYVVTELLKNNIVKKEDISHVFYENAVNIMKELRINEGSPEDFFKLIFDYMLEGMPCDRGNQINESNETMITWETTRDLHKVYWDEVGGNISNYYYFRDSWINGFLSASGTGYEYTRTENGTNAIRKV
ncbi:hypothetical protein [Clostridium magnum]|uniref:Uncharacterized protein n=1 Tax=Clostridium magnum DSM 2767 TaxID=1121326 RepID=A0A162TJN2_9CLOT|nr:hypothetical protein [Clostridium magnum]KZL92731.1 hypothetical protein CLMAG_25450 [Clostridium magnum DSM 2767]SHI24817.1 hypothetical protein SAMN02745944_03600 [Clostridium magnum DSM 2767]